MNLPGLKRKRFRAAQNYDAPNANEADTRYVSCSAYPKPHLMKRISFRDVPLLQTEGH